MAAIRDPSGPRRERERSTVRGREERSRTALITSHSAPSLARLTIDPSVASGFDGPGSGDGVGRGDPAAPTATARPTDGSGGAKEPTAADGRALADGGDEPHAARPTVRTRHVRTATDRPILDVDLIRTRYACHERLDWAVDHDDGIFDEETAAEYDDASDPMFDPAVVGAAVDLLAELAGDGPASSSASGPDGSPSRWRREDRRPRDRPLPADGRPAAGEARWRGRPGHDRGLRHGGFGRRGAIHARLPRVQHRHEPDHAGRPGRRVPERRPAPGARRALPHRGRRPGPAAPATGRAVCRVRWRRRPLGRG